MTISDLRRTSWCIDVYQRRVGWWKDMVHIPRQGVTDETRDAAKVQMLPTVGKNQIWDRFFTTKFPTLASLGVPLSLLIQTLFTSIICVCYQKKSLDRQKASNRPSRDFSETSLLVSLLVSTPYPNRSYLRVPDRARAPPVSSKWSPSMPISSPNNRPLWTEIRS